MKPSLFFWLGTIALLTPQLVNASEYTSVKPLMVMAIDAPDGTAKGILIGPIAERMHQTTQSRDPVQVEVTTIKEFKQEGCKRLNVRLIQPNVPTKDGGRAALKMDYGINFCRDGSAPTEGMDIGAFSRSVQQPSTKQ
jgi:hypothetical protein